MSKSGTEPITEVVAALIWRGDRFMICQRPPHKARGRLYEFVGGKVEPGESAEAALRRECREELDAEILVGELFMEVLHEYPDLTIRLSVYHAKLLSEPKMLEHTDLRFIPVGEIPNYEFCPADRPILDRLENREQESGKGER